MQCICLSNVVMMMLRHCAILLKEGGLKVHIIVLACFGAAFRGMHICAFAVQPL